MKKTIKTIACDCGAVVSGASQGEVMRKEMDHLRMSHPERYQEMLSDLSVKQLFGWLIMQIKQRPSPAM